jgi:hypothetical protein
VDVEGSNPFTRSFSNTMTAALRESSSRPSREQRPQRAEQQPEVHVTWAGWCFLNAAMAMVATTARGGRTLDSHILDNSANRS